MSEGKERDRGTLLKLTLLSKAMREGRHVRRAEEGGNRINWQSNSYSQTEHRRTMCVWGSSRWGGLYSLKKKKDWTEFPLGRSKKERKKKRGKGGGQRAQRMYSTSVRLTEEIQNAPFTNGRGRRVGSHPGGKQCKNHKHLFVVLNPKI